MAYIVMTHGRKGMFLFFVDRTKTKKVWWSYDWTDAMQFQKQTAAQIQANKLKFKKPTVITIDEAIGLSRDNDRNYNYKGKEHLFSS